MRRKMTVMRYVMGVVAVVAMMLLSSCEHKELCFDHVHGAKLKVVFDWSKSPGAAPEEMCLFLYPVNTDSKGETKTYGKPIMYQFAGHDGGYIANLSPGRYMMFCYNSDVDCIDFKDEASFYSFEAYATTGQIDVKSSKKAPVADSTQRIAWQPNPFYTARSEDVLIELTETEAMIRPYGSKSDGDQYDVSGDSHVITFYPELSVDRYNIRIEGMTNLQYASSFAGSLSGMSEGLYVGTNEISDTKVIVPIEEINSDGKSTLTANGIRVFGHVGKDGDPRHWLFIYVIMSDGQLRYKEYDVTDQIDGAKDPKDVEIVLKGFELPKVESKGGFQPTIEDWDEERIDIEM